MKRLQLFCLASTILAHEAVAQQPSGESAPSSFGIGCSVQANIYSSHFQYLPGYPGCSPVITAGSGHADAIMAYWKYRLPGSFFISTEAGYTHSTGSMSVDESTALDIDGIPTAATIAHSIDITSNRFVLSPSIGYTLAPPLALTLSLHFGLVQSPSFSSSERLTEPGDRGVFMENGRRIRNEQQGDLPSANTLLTSVGVGLQYSLALNASRSLAVVPGLRYSLGLTNIVQGLSWKENGFGGSLAIEYSLPAQENEPSTPAPWQPKRDTIIPPARIKPALVASISASGVDSTGATVPAVLLRIEELYEVSQVPLIPYIFFANNADTLEQRYLTAQQHEAAQLERKAGTGRVELYADILNLIGERMTQHPASRLTLTGCTDPSERSHDMELAVRRAERVKQYLTQVWNVAPIRITVRPRALPEHPSILQDTDGQAENRRVEIAATDPTILDAVAIGDTLRVATPPTIQFRPTIRSEVGVASWTLEAVQDGVLLKRFSGTGEPPTTIDWIVSSDQTAVPRAPGQLLYYLHVRDRAGQFAEAQGALQVEQYTIRNKKRMLASGGKAEVEQYSLVLFDFNSSDLSPHNQHILTNIQTRISNRSEVTVTGYSDRIGDQTYNTELALSRARSVATALGLSPAVCRTGIAPYSNDLPEGRFYSRTVVIEIRTPVGSSQ